MKLRNEFEVPVGVEQVWAVLLDVERVAPCLPGATIDGQDGDTYRGSMKLKLGPITSTYKGTVKIEEADEAARRAVMHAQAKDARGQGTAAATITSTMEAVGDSTKVAVETDMRVTGPAAQFGRGVMQDVSAKLMRQFADCLAQRITGGPEAGPRRRRPRPPRLPPSRPPRAPRRATAPRPRPRRRPAPREPRRRRPAPPQRARTVGPSAAPPTCSTSARRAATR